MNPARFPALILMLVLLLPALVCAAPVPAAGKDSPDRPLTVTDAVRYALDHNRLFKAAGQDVLASGEKVKEARADFFPKLDTRYEFKHFQEQPYAALGGVHAFTAPTDSHRWQVEVTQPLFTGFALESQFKIAKADLRISKFKLDEVRLDLIRDVRHAFWQTLLAEKLHEVARDNAESLEVHRKNAQSNYQQGLVAQNDVLKAEVALAQARQQERTTAKQATLLRARFNQLLDRDIEAPAQLVEVEENPPETAGLEELCTLAEKSRPEYLSLETAIRQAGDARTAARSRYWPRVSGFAQYWREGEDAAADNNPYTNNQDSVVGVRMDWNLFEGGKTRAAEKEWAYRRKGLEERLANLKEQIRLEVDDALEQVKLARANVDTAGTALKQAEENERMTGLQYREQLVIFLEVLNAQVFVAQTRADYYQALYGLRTAKADLDRATGFSEIMP